MSNPKTSLGFPRSTSSPASGAGPMPPASPTGQTTNPCGLDPAHANPSALLVSNEEPQMSVTFGPRCTSWSQPSGLLSSLASKWQAGQVSTGSTVYALTWKLRATPQGRSISALRASARLTSGSVCGGWPTPQARDHKGANLDGVHDRGGKGPPLNEVARLASGLPPIGCPAETAKRGQLNPAHSRWLIGLPPAWDDCAPMAMRSSRKSPQKS